MKEFSRSITRPDGAVIGYRILRGDQPRPLIVMIHGLASNMTRWSEFVDHTRLDKNWDLLRLDLRGHGASMYHGRIGVDIWSDDLTAILDREGYRRAIILGHSLGAQIGMHFHHAHPDRVAGMIMIDPVFPQNLGGRLLKAKRVKPLLWLAIRVLWLLKRLGMGKTVFPPRDLRDLDEKTREFLRENPHRDIGQLYTNPFVDLEFIPLANYLQDTHEITRKLPPLKNITQPVLVLLSAGATVSNPQRNLEIIHRLPRVEIETIEANHWLLTEKPREAREAIERWCDGYLSEHPGTDAPR